MRHAFDERYPKAPKYRARYAESAPWPSATRGHGPPFFIIAGIHESVATQKRKPLRNHSLKLLRGEWVREYQRSKATAKNTSVLSPTGGNAPQRRKAGRTRATFLAKSISFVIISDIPASVYAFDASRRDIERARLTPDGRVNSASLENGIAAEIGRSAFVDRDEKRRGLS